MKYDEKRLGEYIDILSGFAFKTKDFAENGIPIIKIKNISPPTVSLDDLTYVSNEIAKKQNKFELSYDDVLIAMTGSHINQWASVVGRVARVKYHDRTLLNQRVGKVTIKENAEADIDYVYYYLSQDSVKIELAAKAGGAANQANISPTQIKELLFPCPNLRMQTQIANMLLAYDNLIENNQKQIKLLEEAAQRLYKEWFVDLHFPGYEDVPMVDGVPEGWERKTVLECLEMYIGGGWGKESIVGKNTIPGRVIRGTDINDIKAGNYRNIPLRFHTENDKKKRSLQTYDIVFELSNGNINNIGRSLLIDNLVLKNCGDNTICASFCKLFRPLDKFHSLVLYSEIQNMQISGRMLPYKKQGSNGINNFAFEDFLTHELLIPNDKAFIIPIENIMAKMSNIQNQFALLNQARDRLLPKLMSGELEV